jgi:hypothetical protein
MSTTCMPGMSSSALWLPRLASPATLLAPLRSPLRPDPRRRARSDIDQGQNESNMHQRHASPISMMASSSSSTAGVLHAPLPPPRPRPRSGATAGGRRVADAGRHEHSGHTRTAATREKLTNMHLMEFLPLPWCHLPFSPPCPPPQRRSVTARRLTTAEGSSRR